MEISLQNSFMDCSLSYTKTLCGTKTLNLNFLQPANVHIPRNIYRKRLISRLTPLKMKVMDVGKQLEENSVIQHIETERRRRSLRASLLQRKESLLERKLSVVEEGQKNSGSPVGKWNVSKRKHRSQIVGKNEEEIKNFQNLLRKKIEDEQEQKQNVHDEVEDKQNIQKAEKNTSFIRKQSAIRTRVIKNKQTTITRPKAITFR